MRKRHLATKELLAIYQGDADDFTALEHLASCSRCQKAFDDSRWIRVLQQVSGLFQTGPHIDANELEAYRHAALPSPRIAQIEHHLRSCTRCLALYHRSRAEERKLHYSSPVPDLVRKARQAFRPGKSRWLGTVLVTGLTQGPRMVLLPERRVASGPELLAGQVHPARGSHPSSATLRAKRLGRSLGAPPAADSGVLSEAAERRSTSEDRARPMQMRSDFPEPLRVEAGDWEVLIHVPAVDPPSRIEVQLTPTDERRSASGIRVLVESPDGDKQDEAETDDAGRAALAVGYGRFRIVVGVAPPLVLNLTVVD